MRRGYGLLIAGWLLCAIPLMAQQVVRVNKPYVLIDVSAKDNIRIGETYRLYRWVGQNAVLTGKIQALVFRDKHCAFKIIEESGLHPIHPDDWLLKPGEVLPQSLAGPQEQNAAGRPSAMRKSSPQYRSSGFSSRWITWSAVGAGVVSGALAYYFWDRADDFVVKTGQAETQREYDYFVEEVHLNDRNSNFCTGLSAGLLVFGTVHYFLTRHAPSFEAGSVAVTPSVPLSRPGVGLTFALRK